MHHPIEIPDEIAQLYQHWDFHTYKRNTINSSELFDNTELYPELENFIHERISIWAKKYFRNAKPYTTDPVLNQYRFCNILREFDRQTIHFHKLLNPLRDDFELWLLNMFWCRMIARTETVDTIGLLSFDPDHNKQVMQKLLDLPSPKYGTPYIFPISVIQRSAYPTREKFLCEYVPHIIPKIATLFSAWKKESVIDGLEKLLPVFGFQLKFLWTEVLIDVAYQYPKYIDLYSEFPVGPGSSPTMKRISKSMKPEKLVSELSKLPLDIGITYHRKPIILSAENWEGISCEFRKYTNLQNGGGRKRRYN
jgi:hypothetical protein